MSAMPASDKFAATAGWAGVLVVLALVVLLLEPHFASVRHQPLADEGYYLSYANFVAEGGWSAFPELFRSWLSEEQNWIHPPPSRVAFVVISAWWHAFGDASLDAQEQLTHLARLSLVAHLCTVAVVFWFVRRQRGELQALLVAASLAFAPLYLGLSRLALTDSFITLCQVLSLALFFELVHEPRRWLWRIGFVLCFSLAILAKELSVLLGVPFVALVLIERFVRKRPLVAWHFVLILAVPFVVSLLVWLAAAGSFDVLARTLQIVLSSPATNEYAQMYGGGPWYRYIVDELLLSPWPVALGLLGLAIAAWQWRRGKYDALLAYSMLLYVAQITALSFFTKNVRYAAVLELPLRLLAVALLCDVFAVARWRSAKVAAIAAVALSCATDWASFRHLFVEREVYDPMTANLLVAQDCVPAPAAPGDK